MVHGMSELRGVRVVLVEDHDDSRELLALMLAARYRKPVPIILGILFATLANHALAAWLGGAVAGWIGADTMRWILGISFIVMAGWCLIPDKADDGPQAAHRTTVHTGGPGARGGTALPP